MNSLVTALPSLVPIFDSAGGVNALAGVLFCTCSKGKDDSWGYFEWRDKKEDEDPFEPFSTVYFSNPPSCGYTVKETGENFTSLHENRIEACKEYLSLKTKEENL